MKAIVLICVSLLFGIGTFYLLTRPKLSKSPPPLQSSIETKVQNEDFLLPDLFILPPKDIFISVSNGKKLRFTSSYGNKGRGPLELIGHSDPVQSVTYASQYLAKVDGTGTYREVGRFVFHPAHNHWHVDNYVQYQLWGLKDDRPDKMLATTAKQSVCLWDERSYDLNLPGAPQKRVFPYPCGKETQGFSVGWGDVYDSKIPGQEISLSGIPDGTYILRNVVNPENKIIESSTENNVSEVYITITGSRVKTR